MIRNLVFKLPSLTCSTEIRQRTFRSLSPIDKFSQNKIKTSSETSLSSRPLNRSVTYTSKHFNQSNQIEENEEEPLKEIKWREQPQKRKSKIVKEKKKKELKAEEAEEIKEEQSPVPQIQYYEQYELEAARPRCGKSREIIDKLRAKPTQSMFGTQLQPNELQPYGSRENVFSYNLIASTNTRSMRKKLIKKESNEDEDGQVRIAPSRRSYSTNVNPKIVEQEQENESTELKKIEPSSREHLQNTNTNFRLDIQQNKPRLPWGSCKSHFDISPPKFKVTDNEDNTFVKFSSQQAYRQRREQANKDAASYYKQSYSDLIRLKDRDLTKVESVNQTFSKPSEQCVVYTKITKKVDPILDSKLKTPVSTPTIDKRSMSTSSGSNALSRPILIKNKQRSDVLNVLVNPQAQLIPSRNLLNVTNPVKDQKTNYSKSKNKTSSRKECYDPCREQKNKLKSMIRVSPQMEPKDSDCKDPAKSNKVFLVSKVRLPVVKCLPKFEYDCRAPEPCPPRADECLRVLPKRLPVMVAKECPCVEQPLKDSPKLKRLCFEFKDPPREKCFQEPCTTPRADDENPYKFKPLRPLEMGECECIEPPPMTDVKLKRLPPCQPEEVCWPVREPCIPEPCPPRADECLKVLRKRLPVMEPPVCPCEEPPPMTAPPPLPRLCLDVPEPKRICPPPPVCECKERADKCFKPKKKVLPKFVPGDCPCEDRPMTDIKFKRLECIDEPRCAIKIPDDCQPFPRADYGCWEFEEDTCYEVPEHCIEKKPDPCNPPRCKDPCERRDICKTSGPLSYNPKRKYNTDSTSMKLFNRLKNRNSDGTKPFEQKNMTLEAAAIKKDVVMGKSKKTLDEKLNKALKTNVSLTTIRLLKELDKLDAKGEKKNITFNARNSKKSSHKVDYDTILKKIESTSALINKSKNCKSTRSLSVPLCISSRAISTSHATASHEKKIRDEKNLECKKKCQKLKPKTLCHAKGIKGGLLCGQTKCKDTNMCKKERVPVCCEKEEAPYAAFSDKIYDMKVNPYKDLNHCYKCLKTRWPCTPDYKPDCDKRKFFSTSSLLNELPVEFRFSKEVPNKRSFRHSLISDLGLSPKATVSNPALSLIQSHSFATKVFKIKKPEIKCDDLKSTTPAQKIMCINYDYDPCQTTKKSCKRIFYEKTTAKIKTPYPAFSDCLDEDMEDILGECPLERDRYTQLQPRHIPPADPVRTPLPPPPKSEPLDLLKEQHCIKARLGKYKGTTQDCKTFGDKVKLLKSRDVFKEPNKDCERVEQLKKEGRWPPLTLIQNRHPYSTVAKFFQSRQFSTFRGLNSIHEITKEVANSNHNEVKRIYIRNFHSLTKNPDKSIFTEIDSKMKEFTMKQFPDVSDSCKLLKLKNDQWRKNHLKKFTRLNERVNIPIRVKRFYTSYKIKHKYYLKKSARNVCSKAVSMQRRSSDARLKFFKPQDDKKQCKKSNAKCDIKDGKSSKFILDNCPVVGNVKCNKQTFFTNDCEKPNTPYPSFSECGDHDLSRPFCECPGDSQQMDDLQPKFSVLPVLEKKKYPTEDKIDTTLGREYCRQKMGMQKGLTFNCETFPEYVSAKKSKKTYRSKSQISEVPPEKPQPTKPKLECQPTKPPKNALKEEDNYNVEIECVIADKKEPCDPCRDLQACCSQILEKHMCEEKKKSKPIMPPCCLPEEDGACREYCRKIVLSDNLSPQEESYKDFCKKIICYENSDAHHGKPDKLYEDEAICKNTSKDVKEFCKKIVEVKSKEVPEKVSGLSEECAQKLMQDCEKIAHLAEKCLKKYAESESNKKVVCDDVCKTEKSKSTPKPKPKVQCKPNCEEPPKPKCPKFKVQCEVSKEACQAEPSTMLSLWQRVINYFKARPGCPEPGDWKKKALNDKAHKAAAAAGLVAIDPKCLSSEVLTKARSDPCCRACPSEQPICKPPENKHEDEACKTTKGTKSSALTEKKGKFGMFRRNYSKSFSWTNLEEINKILEEDRQEKNIQRASKYLNKEFAVFSKRDDHTEQIQKSLEYQLKAFPLRISTVSRHPPAYPRSYFGYTNILPSRENVLERAWRLSMEAAKKKQGKAQAAGLLNEIFKKVDNSVKSQEDIEKTKTENVLRELDQFLNLKEDSNEDNK